jgi:hypothetical protein
VTGDDTGYSSPMPYSPRETIVVERRAHVRHEVRLAGELIWDGGAQRQPCTIRDISLDGARVETRSFAEMPTRIFLHEKEDGNLFECEVRWLRGGEMGLFFLDAGSRMARRALIQEHATSSTRAASA